MKRAFPNVDASDGDAVWDVLNDIYEQEDERFIFVLDEWDYIFHRSFVTDREKLAYLEFLSNLLKGKAYVELAYMTGILPIAKYSSGSELNMFLEYSMTDQGDFEEYTGFTEDEVKVLCEKYAMDFALISNWYDGYKFREFQHIYNPRSVVAAMKNRVLSSYWTSTETYEALKVYMDMDFDGLRSDIVQMLGGGRVRVNIQSFQNDMQVSEQKTMFLHC